MKVHLSIFAMNVINKKKKSFFDVDVYNIDVIIKIQKEIIISMCMHIIKYPLVISNNVYQVSNIVVLIWLNVISLG